MLSAFQESETGGEMDHKSEPRREKVTKEAGENRHGFNEVRFTFRVFRGSV